PRCRLAVHGRDRAGRRGALRGEDPGRRARQPQDRRRRRLLHREGQSCMSERPTVVVTGLGAITPLGGDVASTWEGMLAGRSGITRLDDEWARDFPARLVARMSV